MPTNYTWIPYTDKAGRDFSILKTKASNLQLVNLYTENNKVCQKIKDSGYSGMNASFFNSDESLPRFPALHNIVVQDGRNKGCNIRMPNQNNAFDGTVNITGSSLIYWTGSVLNCAKNVDSASSSIVPETTNSWAQGGFGLYLCNRNWKTEYNKENNAASYPVGEGAARTGILINKKTNDVYLFACRILTTTVYDLRNAMMEYAGLTEGGSAGDWAGIMTDGGKSTQLYCGAGSTHPITYRAVPQIIALKKTT